MIDWCVGNKLYTILWCGSNKSDGLHNKCPHTRGNIKWRSFALRFCASTLNAHDDLCFPLQRAYLLLYVFTLCLSQGDPHLSLFILSFGKLLVFERSWYIYPIGCKLAWAIIVDITQRWIRWEAHNKPLSFSVSEWNSITTSTAWVLAIVEDYEIVEYVSLLKSSIIDYFWCYNKLQLAVCPAHLRG